MTDLNARMTALNDASFGEPEQDANTALIELDKGLRSTKIGEQCQSIVRFPKLFEKYPFPILINSSLLKLAEVFRVGSNFLRVWVLRVCQQSEKHLDKILNTDEFLRRIYSVMNSNDPVAKALTLRTLGSVARIIPEKKQVHHSIRRSLDGHDLVEVEAAIFAAQMFAAQSKVFAIFLCSKIADMIRGQATPASMKLQLIPILQYMHHDISTASLANELCMELLKSYPAVEFVRTTLSASTTLTSATLIDVPAQVLLLLQYSIEEPRYQIKRHATLLLHSLAKKGGHLWPREAFMALIDNALRLLQEGIENTGLIIQILDVINLLCQSAVTCEANSEENSPIMTLCFKACHFPDPAVAVKAATVLTKLACYCYEENLPVQNIRDVTSCLENLINILALANHHLRQLKVCLALTIKLCQIQKNHCGFFVNVIGSTLVNLAINDKLGNVRAKVLCESLGAFGNLERNALLSLLPDILMTMQRTSCGSTKVLLCNLLFQTVAVGFKWSRECLIAIDSVANSVDDWEKYKIARAAARYGHHQIAKMYFGILNEAVASEHFYFWLLGLEQMCSAESFLSDENFAVIDKEEVCWLTKLNGAAVRYSSACACLRAACTSIRSLQFSCEYAKLRYEFIQTLLQVLHNCRSLCTSPPYAIAAHQAHTAKDELLRYGRITTQLRTSVQNLKNCANSYQALYQSAFDADTNSLNNVRALQELCLLIAHSVQRVSGGPSVSMSHSATSEFCFGDTIEMQQLAHGCNHIKRIALSCDTGSGIPQNKANGVSHVRVNNIISQIHFLASGKMRFPVPRYFFQILQTTNIKLSVWPQPRVSGEAVSIPQGTQLALKVEGVIRHGQNASLFRSVAAISITISTTPTGKNSSDRKEPISELEQTVIPARDFFSCEFLLSLGNQHTNSCVNAISCNVSGGQYQVIVSANIIDESNNIWRIGPRNVLQIKVLDEPVKRKPS